MASSHEMIDRVFWSTSDYHGFESICESFRSAKSVCIITDEEHSRPFVAPYIYTCSCCGVTVADENWNCVAFTEENVLSVRPVSNDYYVYTFELETSCEVFPRQSEEIADKNIVYASFLTLPKGDVKAQEKRSDDESYKAFDIGLNRLFTGIYDLDTLGWFCDSAMAVYDSTSDPDNAMIMLTLNERVQDPSASVIYVNEIEFYRGVLTLTAEAENGDELNLTLTADKVSGVERVACVNNGFYCVEIDLAAELGKAGSYLQLGIFF